MKNIENEDRANHGGSWGNAARYCLAASRIRDVPDGRVDFIGFRTVLRRRNR